MTRRAKQVPPYVAKSVPRRLLAACQSTTETALVSLLYRGALRVGEATALQWVSLDLADDPPTLTVGHHWSRDRRSIEAGGKGGKILTIPMGAPLVAALEAQRPAAGGSPWVFPSPRKPDSPITTKHAWAILKRVAARSGLDPAKVWPHLLRHGAAEHQIEAGVTLDEVRDFLRHADIATTGLYLQTNQQRLRRAAEALE